VDHHANIDEKELTGSFTAENKTYDGNVSATIATARVTARSARTT
jgi:hypothetical protein